MLNSKFTLVFHKKAFQHLAIDLFTKKLMGPNLVLNTSFYYRSSGLNKHFEVSYS